MRPELSIVIVNYRSWRHLEECLGALLAEQAGAPSLDLVVVDNASDDGELESFERRFSAVRFVANRGNLGYASGCNLGAALARAERLLFLNPDVVATPAQLGQLLEVWDRHPEVGILTAAQADSSGRERKVCDVFPGPLANLPLLGDLAKRKARRRRACGPDRLVECDWVSGSALLLRKADLERLGGWDDHYFLFAEDVDLCYRARRHGLLVACCRAVELVHHHGAATRRDEATQTLAKTEVIISKHVFYERNYRGSVALAAHLTEATKRGLRLVPAAVADLLTLGQMRSLRLRRRVLYGVATHYLRRLRTGSFTSPRSPRFSGG